MTDKAAFAFVAGMLATVNPCGFALLPAFLASVVGITGEQPPNAVERSMLSRLARGLTAGAAVSAGFAAVVVGAGLLVAAGLRALVGAVPWAALVIGFVLAGIGVLLLTGRRVRLRIGSLRSRIGGLRRMVLFGGAYAVASLSCTLAVLLAVVAQAVATADLAGTVAVFLAYGAGAAAVLILLSVSAALTSTAVARGIRRVIPHADRISGAVLLLSGLYLIAYWAPAVTGGRPAGPLSRTAATVSGELTSVLAAHSALVAGLAAVATIVGTLAVLATRRQRAGARADCCSLPDTQSTTDHDGTSRRPT